VYGPLSKEVWSENYQRKSGQKISREMGRRKNFLLQFWGLLFTINEMIFQDKGHFAGLSGLSGRLYICENLEENFL